MARLRSRYAASFVVLTDSGTSALTLALLATARAGDHPVAIPAYACYDIATAVEGAGARFLLYDIDPVTLGPDLGSLDRALQAGADRVVVVHLYGVPVLTPEVRTMTERAGARLIDDAAQGSGVLVQGVPAGMGGTLGVLSFGRGKGVTGGSGGALLGSQPHPSGLPPMPRDGARGGRSLLALLAQWALARPSLYGLPASLPFLGLGETVHRAPSTPLGIPASSLGVLRRTLDLVEQEVHRRREVAMRLRAGWEPSRLSAPTVSTGTVAGFLRCPAVATPGVAAAARGVDARRLGIMPGYPRALCDLPGFGERRLNPEERCDGARLLAERLLTFPCHGLLDERDVEGLEAWARTDR